MNKVKNKLLFVIFGLVTGNIVGLLVVIFGKGLVFVTSIKEMYFYYLIGLLPFIGLVIIWLYKKYGGVSHQGMTLIFDVANEEQVAIPKRMIPLVIITTWLTHLFGGSAGREGVAVQIGATCSHYLGERGLKKILPKHDELSKIMIVTGMAAGFSGLFQIPIAATCFALEVLVVGEMSYIALLPAVTASFTSFFVSQKLGLEKFSVVLPESVTWEPVFLLKLSILGLLFGLVGVLFTRGLRGGKKIANQLLPNPYYRILIGGGLLAMFLVLAHHGRYSGLGTNLIEESLLNGTIYYEDFMLKMILTILTLSVGFQGGEVTPLFAIGCSFGAVLAPLIGVPVALGASLGYIAVFGSATNTFLAPIMIGGEVFGFHLMPYYFVVMSMAYICNGNQSIYSKQKVKKERIAL